MWCLLGRKFKVHARPITKKLKQDDYYFLKVYKVQGGRQGFPSSLYIMLYLMKELHTSVSQLLNNGQNAIK